MKTRVAQGMALLAQLQEVMPEQADERVRALYEESKDVLRVPFVNFLFRALANDADYLEQAWRGLVPLLRTGAFERTADALRSRALLPGFDHDARLDWERLGDVACIRAFTDSIHYVLPKLLLVATALAEPELAGTLRPPMDEAELPHGPAEGSVRVEMVDPAGAPPPVAALFADIQRVHGHSKVATYYRALGRWPVFLEEAWKRLSPVVGSAEYVARREHLVVQARELLRGLPFQPTPPQRSTLNVPALLAAFRERLIPDLLLDVTAIRALLLSAEQARTSHLSAVRAPDAGDWPAELHPLTSATLAEPHS